MEVNVKWREGDGLETLQFPRCAAVVSLCNKKSDRVCLFVCLLASTAGEKLCFRRLETTASPQQAGNLSFFGFEF